jgi:tetratricopeptide (TPR) repeat protein
MARISVPIREQKRNPDAMTPNTASDYLTRGWYYYSAKEYAKAETDFRQALVLEADDVDTLFAHGLALKHLSRFDEAVQTFEKVIVLSDQNNDPVRATMVKRLAKGHINELTLGDWNLEKEVWKTR